MAGILALTVTFFVGKKIGWKSAIALFHELQDDGELIVLTLAQQQEAEMGRMQGAIYDENDAGDDLLEGTENEAIPGVVPEKRPREQKRQANWAETMLKNKRDGTL